MISPMDLISKFQQALEDDWGYIWGTAGVLWTEAKQKALEKTTDEDRAMGRKYGSKWIGHMVADCSGLFSWAFAQLGGYMYHGSNTMWDKYCSSQGELKKGKRTDGKELLPGTAVFTYNKSKKKRGHVGLYIGGGWVIEAEGTINGVIKSKVTNSKWVEWGELKGVEYKQQLIPAGRAIVTGKDVALRQGPSAKTPVLTRVKIGSLVDISHVVGWTYVKYGSRFGFMMNDYISLAENTATVTGKKVALRAGPSLNDKVLTRIKTGVIVDRAELPDGWRFVEYSGYSGFMMKEYLREG